MADNGYVESDVRYLRAIFNHPDPVVTAPELADEVGVTQQAAYDKLAAMRDRGLVKSKKAGARSVVWWLTTDGIDAYTDATS